MSSTCMVIPMPTPSRICRLLATVAAATGLLLLDRLGLSRGVMVIDFLLCSLLITGSRLTFRLLESATGRWSRDGIPVVVLGPIDDADLAIRQLHHLKNPKLRPVAVADPSYPRLRSRMGAYPAFGGEDALESALRDSRVNAVVVVGTADGNGHDPSSVERFPSLLAHLESEGSLDVFRLRVSVEAEREGTGRPSRHA